MQPASESGSGQRESSPGKRGGKVSLLDSIADSRPFSEAKANRESSSPGDKADRSSFCIGSVAKVRPGSALLSGRTGSLFELTGCGAGGDADVDEEAGLWVLSARVLPKLSWVWLALLSVVRIALRTSLQTGVRRLVFLEETGVREIELSLEAGVRHLVLS